MNDKKSGLHTEVTSKGYKIETYFTDGVRDGKETIWYPNGNKHSEVDYKRVWNSKKHSGGPGRKEQDDYIDCRDGKEIYYWEETGNKELEFNYSGGFQNGKQTRWHPNGQKSQEYFTELRLSGVTYHGTETNWHPNGQKSYERHYKDDEAYGIWTEWDEDGKVVFEHNDD